MRRSHKNQRPDLGEHEIFGDEEAAQLRADLRTVSDRVDELTERVNAQFTSISAHAEISREQIDRTRDEARADMERSRDLVIGLIDRLRDEVSGGSAASTAPSSDPIPGLTWSAVGERLDQLELAVDRLTTLVNDSIERQHRMAATMTAFIDTILGQQTDDPVAGLALS